MTRSAALFFALFITRSLLFGQIGNEWVDYSQHYVRIPVGKDGVYRLTQTALQDAGFPVSGIDPVNLQLFHRGAEQAILVTGEGDHVFDEADYLEFYGRRNDGTLDRELYRDPSWQPHNLQNIFSDTTSYFLTVGSAPGKRMAVKAGSDDGLTADPFHSAVRTLLLHLAYSPGKDPQQYVNNSEFGQGEGWMSNLIYQNQPPTFFEVTGLTQGFTDAPDPEIEIVFTGRGPMRHLAEVYVGSSQRLLASVPIVAFENKKFSAPIQWSDIDANGVLKVGVRAVPDGTDLARFGVGYVRVRYSKSPDMLNAAAYAFQVEESDVATYHEIQNAPASTRLFDVSDPNNVGIVQSEVAGGILTTVIAPADTATKLFAFSEFLSPAISKVSFREIVPLNHDYIIVTHPVLRKPAAGYDDPVRAYAEYRASPEGGSFDTLVVNVTDLYDAFTYGEQTPLAIFRFMRFLSTPDPPDYLFIIGKGLDFDIDYFRNPNSFQFKSLVPPSGLPGTDFMFTLDPATHVVRVPTGRITAMQPSQVAAYLEKVIEMEAKPFDDLRRKNLLHLSGGIYTNEPAQFRSILAGLADKARGPYLGGEVKAVAKQSTDIKLINVADEVNEGVNMITFFGHSSPGVLDFDIGKVTDPVLGYDNKGQYPIMLMNGCSAGSFYLHAELFGENWINTADKGALAFVAHSSFGFVEHLRKYSGIFYDVGYRDSSFIKRSVGRIQQEVAARFISTSSVTEIDIAQVQQMVLLGDPAVKLFGAPAPDYSIEEENIIVTSFSDEPVTARSDSFAIRFIVRNYGLATPTPLEVTIRRTLSDGTLLVYDSVFAPLYYADTLTFVIRGQIEQGFGNNIFEIRLDANHEAEEIREDNNVAFLNYFVPLHGTRNLYPPRYGIVSQRNVGLTFQHTDLRSEVRSFLIELDTTRDFTSGFKQTFEVSSAVLARQEVELLAIDSLPYFWRTRLLDPSSSESADWLVSSFTFIDGGPEGWAQVSADQFQENTFDGLVRDGERIRFSETITPVAISTFGGQAGLPANQASIRINHAEYNLQTQGFGCRGGTLNLVAFDRHTTVPYLGVAFNYTNFAGRACGREPWAINSFTAGEMFTGNNDDLIKYIDNIAAGDSVVLFTIGDAAFVSWPAEARQKLGELGISTGQLDALEPGEPVIIFGRKGIAPGSASITRSVESFPATRTITRDATMTGRRDAGSIESVIVGPALEWGQLIVKTGPVSPSDEFEVDIFGVDNAGVETVVVDSAGVTRDLGAIDAASYPQLRLRYEVTDNVDLTPVQLEKWIVSYQPAPEGLLFYDGPMEASELPEGINWQGNYGFVNTGQYAFPDSLDVAVKVSNVETVTSTTETFRILPPAPGDTTHFVVTINTYRRTGTNDIEVFVNPFIVTEQYYDNNVYALNRHLTVTAERFNPVLDVSVDGRYIRNGDFVSTDPWIIAKLYDDNPFLLKQDTTGFDFFISSQCIDDGCTWVRIPFSNPDVQWSAATASTPFIFQYHPAELPDGKYALRIVAEDGSGNPSGSEPYEVSFQIRRETHVEIAGPAPNPAPGDVRFFVTASGSTPLAKLSLEVFSLKGNLIHKIQYADVQMLTIGTNVIRWSPVGDKGFGIPEGVYVYRIIATSEAGEVFEKRGKVSIIY